jgi:hypothetical protein
MHWIGGVTSAVGLYFVLVGLDVMPIPGGRGSLHAPLWIALLAGLVFFLGGCAVLLQARGRANDSGELPPDAPRWMRVAQYLIGVAIFASFALIGSWVAIGGDPRQFSGSFGEHGIGVTVARAAFGFGAIICWLATIAFATAGARKLLGHGKTK